MGDKKLVSPGGTRRRSLAYVVTLLLLLLAWLAARYLSDRGYEFDE